MLATDEDALICDFAETYHILDYRALPVKQRAVLASGLRENSRIKMKLAGLSYIPAEFSSIRAADYLGRIFYCLAAKENSEPPELLSDIMAGRVKEKPQSFSSGAEYEAWRARILKGVTPDE